MRSGDEIFEFDSENDEIETEYDANYPEDEDEDENALWDDGEDTADADTEIELTSKAQRQIARERRLIDELEADAAENPIEDEIRMRTANAKNSNVNCKQKPLPVWRMPQELCPILRR